MGVPFANKDEFDATVSSVVNNMYAGYRPTIEDIQLFADRRIPDNAADILALLRVRDEQKAIG